MNTTLWVLQSLLALAMLGAGAMKLFKSRDALVANPAMGWAQDYSEGQIKLIGLVEVLGGVGLVLPWYLAIVPILTPIAASGLVVIMGGAAMVHLRRKESAAPPIVLALLCAFVAAGRFGLIGG